MGRLIFVLLLLAAGVVGLGFYQGWFSFSTESADKKTNITITVDQEKIKEIQIVHTVVGGSTAYQA